MVRLRYKKSQWEYEKNALIAVMSIYGIDIMEDNVYECRKRIFDYVKQEYKASFKTKISENFLQIVKFILSKNILCGDALSMKTIEGVPIIFAEWAFVKGSLVQRRDFSYEQLLTQNDKDTLFGDFIEKPIKIYPITHYLRLEENE